LLIQETEMNAVTDDNFDALLSRNNTCMVMFGASWCGPCNRLKPLIEQIAGDNVAYFDVEGAQTPRKFNLRGVPTLIVFQNGEEVTRAHTLTPQIRQLLGS